MYIFLGAFLVALSFAIYFYVKLHTYDGAVTIGKDEDVTTYFLDLRYEPEVIATKKRIIFEVVLGDDSGV